VVNFLVDMRGGGENRNYALNGKRNADKIRLGLHGSIITWHDYKVMSIPDGSLVYCDPPYSNTTGYRDKFNHDEFWEWVRDLSRICNVFVSEYVAPGDFECIFEESRECGLKQGINGKGHVRIEKIFKKRAVKVEE